MIITLKIPSVNFKRNLPQQLPVFSKDELQELISHGAIIKKNKQYRMIIYFRQYIIECPILLTTDGQYQLILPSFKLPNRQYPICVYLYAAALYLSGGESMRATAQKVIRAFGLETFSHTTISRFLRKLYLSLPYFIRYGAQVINTWGVTTSQVIRRKHWDEPQYEKAQQLNELLDPVLRSPPEFSNWLAYQYWQDTQNFII